MSTALPDTLYEGDRSTVAVVALGATIVRLRIAVWLKAPDVAVTVTCDVAAAAVLLTVSNTSTPELTVAKAAVTPVGGADTDRFTLPANPLSGVKVMALDPFPPWRTRRLGGASAIEKSGGGVTVIVIVTAEVRLPEVPVTVKGDAFSAAVLAALSVSVLVVVALAGLKDAVTPVGKPVAVKPTVPLKPASVATVMVALALLPAATFMLVAEEESVKLGVATTVKAIVACADSPADVAVTVSVDAPLTAVAAALSFKVVPVNAAVTPAGKPVTDKVGVPLKPLTGVTVRVLVPDPPCVTIKLAGAAANVKPGPAFIVKLTLTVVDTIPEVPVTVTVVVPTAAAEVALNVATLVVEVDTGPNETVTPVGRVDVVKVTLPVKPLFGVTVMVLVPLAPSTTLSVGVEVAIEKDAVGATVKAIATVALRLPDLPVMVTVAVPAAAVGLAVKVTVLAVAVLAGLNPAVTPPGRPETVRATALVKPFAATTVIEVVFVALSTTVKAAADVVSV